MSEFKALVGIDWGSVHHQVVLVDTAGQILGDRSFRHDGAGMAAMADWILARADALRTDPAFFRRLEPDTAEVIELREWTRIAGELTAERCPLVDRMKQ